MRRFSCFCEIEQGNIFWKAAAEQKEGNKDGQRDLPKKRSEGDFADSTQQSAAHRAVLCAALSQGNCEIGNLELSDDLTATVNAVKALGGIASYDKKRKTLLVQSADLGGKTAEIDCLESGSTLRFMIPVAAALGSKTTFYGKGRLPQRPLGIYQKLLPEHGVLLQTEGGLPLKMEGKRMREAIRFPATLALNSSRASCWPFRFRRRQ